MSNTYCRPVSGIVDLEPAGDDGAALVYVANSIHLVGSFFLRYLRGEEALNISSKGTGQGYVVTELLPDLRPHEYLIGEDGELATVYYLRVKR